MKNSVIERLSHLSNVTQDAYGTDYVIYHVSPEPQSSAWTSRPFSPSRQELLYSTLNDLSEWLLFKHLLFYNRSKESC